MPQRPLDRDPEATFADVFKLTTRREVTIDVYVNYHGTAPQDETSEDFDRKVMDSISREMDRRVLT